MSNRKLALYVLQTLALSSSLFIMLSLHMVSGLARPPAQHQLTSQMFSESKNLFDLEPLFADQELSTEFQSSKLCFLSEPSELDYCTNMLALANGLGLAQKYRFQLLVGPKWQRFIRDNLDPDALKRMRHAFRMVDKVPSKAARLSAVRVSHCEPGEDGLTKVLRIAFTPSKQVKARMQLKEAKVAVLGEVGSDCELPTGSAVVTVVDTTPQRELVSKVWSSVAHADWFLVGDAAKQSSCARLIHAWRAATTNLRFKSPLFLVTATAIAPGCAQYAQQPFIRPITTSSNSPMCQ
ncbi:hypothetical protein BASA81_008028 [Batrachochytrium salamandrivorans]|nr:hypothetical protein BASA81_008028 [Batrachochytrium salamandrivorans]